MLFLKDLWFRLFHGVPYHEHQWSPLNRAVWGCTYQTKDGKSCTAIGED